MSELLNSRLKTILSDWMTPTLKPLGFQKRGSVYLSAQKDLSWLFAIELGKWNDSSRKDFTFSCGVYVPKVVAIYVNRPEPKAIGLTDCCIWSRIGLLSESRLDSWWTLETKDELPLTDHVIGADIRNRLEVDCMPFLKKFETRKAVLHFLELPRPRAFRTVWPQSEGICRAYAAILYALAGEREKGLALIDAAPAPKRRAPAKDMLSNLRHRLEKGCF